MCVTASVRGFFVNQSAAAAVSTAGAAGVLEADPLPALPHTVCIHISIYLKIYVYIYTHTVYTLVGLLCSLSASLSLSLSLSLSIYIYI